MLDPATDPPVGLQIRERNGDAGVDVAIEVSGLDRGLQGALAAAGLGGTVVAAGFYQGGAANVRLGEEFHHNRLSLIASVGAWGAPSRHAPLWDRRRMLDTATRLLYTDRVVVDGLLGRTFRFDEAPAAYQWLDEHPRDAVKVALAYRDDASAATLPPLRGATPAISGRSRSRTTANEMRRRPSPGQVRRERGVQHPGEAGPAVALAFPGEVVVVCDRGRPVSASSCASASPRGTFIGRHSAFWTTSASTSNSPHEPVQGCLELRGAVPEGLDGRRFQWSGAEQVGLQLADARVDEMGPADGRRRARGAAELAGEPHHGMAVLLQDGASLAASRLTPFMPHSGYQASPGSRPASMS